jgi:hypothetical protein
MKERFTDMLLAQRAYHGSPAFKTARRAGVNDFLHEVDLHFKAGWEAALAQQAQPLTDEMIEAEAEVNFRSDGSSLSRGYHICFAMGAKFARDRMA